MGAGRGRTSLRTRVAFLIAGVLIGALAVKLTIPGLSRLKVALSGIEAPPPRIERACAASSGKTAIIVVHGQSNAGNHGTARYTAREAVDNFDPLTGKCFAAADPLLGTDGVGGNFATRLGDILIRAGRYDRVVVVPIALGGASISWLNNQSSDRITNAIVKLQAANLTPTHILFQQGERDAMLKTTEGEYATQLRGLVKRFRAAGFAAPFYVSQSTRCDMWDQKNATAVRAGQLSVIDDLLNIRRGPDTDLIGNDGRDPDDGCHMNELGTLANAALWAAFVE
jgi:hypothetical protein